MNQAQSELEEDENRAKSALFLQYSTLMLILLTVVVGFAKPLSMTNQPVVVSDISESFKATKDNEEKNGYARKNLASLEYPDLFEKGSNIPNKEIVEAISFLISEHDLNSVIEVYAERVSGPSDLDLISLPLARSIALTEQMQALGADTTTFQVIAVPEVLEVQARIHFVSMREME